MAQLKKQIQFSALLVICRIILLNNYKLESPYFFCLIPSFHNHFISRSYQNSEQAILNQNNTKTKQLISSSLTTFSLFIDTILSESPRKNIQINKDQKNNPGEYIMCESILLLKKHNTSQRQFQLIIPINFITLTSFSILFILIILGSFYVWKILTIKKCMCPLCKGIYCIIEKVDEGGFGEVSLIP